VEGCKHLLKMEAGRIRTALCEETSVQHAIFQCKRARKKRLKIVEYAEGQNREQESNGCGLCGEARKRARK